MTPHTAKAALLKSHLYKTKLENGMTLLVKEVPGSKAATVQIWVKAGSIYEAEDEGGITHLIEHMIFKGTETRGPGEVAKGIEEKGGRINAYTSYEYTVYHATISGRYWGSALEVLGDAIRHSVFDPDELEKEKQVVLEEIGMRNDRPTIQLFQSLMSTAYEKHPYRLPIIGTEESVSSFSRQDILDYMAKHYHPDNFTVVVVGDVRYQPVEEKVKALFDDLPRNPQPAANDLVREPAQKRVRLFSLEDDVNQAHLAMAFPASSFSSPDSAVLAVMAAILGQGDTSRLYHELRNEKSLVYNIHASSFSHKDPGLFEVTATLAPDKLLATMEAALAETFKLKYVPVEEEELTRVKRSLESDFIFSLEQVQGQARIIGSFEFLAGDPREDDYLDKIRAVTAEDIQQAAKKYLNGHRLTAGFLAPNGTGLELDEKVVSTIVKAAEKEAKRAIPTSLVANSYLGNIHRFTLENGLTLLVRENPQVPTVAIRAVFPGGLKGETQATNGAFAFISELLPKSTEKQSARELAITIADMAGEVSGFNGKNTFGLKAAFLSRFFEPGLTVIRDILRTPAFDPQEAEKIRPERIAQIKREEDSLPTLTFKEFNRILFQGHPYGLNTSGSIEALERLTTRELKEIYNSHARPEQLVLTVAGDVKAETVKEQVEALFGDWHPQGDMVEIDDHLAPDPPATAKLKHVTRDKEQLHIVIGFLGTTLDHEDRFAMEIMDTVLSGQSGRLFRQLRDEQSLAYSLSSFAHLGLDTGSFGIYIGTSPDKKEEAIQGAWQELYRLRQTPIEEEELEKAKNVLIGHYELSLQTNGSQAMEMALSETYDLGQDFGNRYIHEISRITAEDLLRAAQKYIQPDHYILVTVGAE